MFQQHFLNLSYMQTCTVKSMTSKHDSKDLKGMKKSLGDRMLLYLNMNELCSVKGMFR